MRDDTKARPKDLDPVDFSRSFEGRQELLELLYQQAKAFRWNLPKDRFANALTRSVQKRFGGVVVHRTDLREYTTQLHLEDLALACACAEGIEAAWEHFVATYRQYLYAAAGAITKRSSSDPYAREFADSLYATLYGKATTLGRVSLFEHFHGRSKLSTWLRAVLAQRYVDILRQEKRFEALEDEEGNERVFDFQRKSGSRPLDPDCSRYLKLLAEALTEAISSLGGLDRTRLICYYVNEMTLAEIGKTTQEHEATVSRKLERIRSELKEKVIRILREGRPQLDGRAASPGLSDAQIRLCFEYAIEEWPFDLQRVLSGAAPRKSKPKTPSRSP